jgi:hypothetical protein
MSAIVIVAKQFYLFFFLAIGLGSRPRDLPRYQHVRFDDLLYISSIPEIEQSGSLDFLVNFLKGINIPKRPSSVNST